MKEYHKIQTVYKRDPNTKHKTLLVGEFSIPEFEYLKNNIWEWSEKVDGTNIRVMWNGEKITYGGKTDNAQIPQGLMNRLIELFGGREEEFKEIFSDANEVCIYGEGHGEKIQKGGGNYCKGQDFVGFDIKIGHWWLQRENVEGILEKLGLKVVPIIGKGTIDEMVEYVKTGFNSEWGDFIAEGVVAKPKVELFARNGGRIITKLKHRDFLRG